MHQNCEEMRTLREQNKEMHNDVRLIKELLRASRDGALTGRSTNGNQHMPFTTQTHGVTTAISPQGPGRMTGGTVTQRPTNLKKIMTTSSSILRPRERENSRLQSSSTGNYNNVRTSLPTDRDLHDKMASARDSPDQSARTMSPTKTTQLNFPGVRSSPNLQQQGFSRSDTQLRRPSQNFPPVASIRDGVIPVARQSTKVGLKSAGRKGPAKK